MFQPIQQEPFQSASAEERQPLIHREGGALASGVVVIETRIVVFWVTGAVVRVNLPLVLPAGITNVAGMVAMAESPLVIARSQPYRQRRIEETSPCPEWTCRR
jgi:hypothetical protein